MRKEDFLIKPDTKVGQILDSFPQLEDVLLDMSPAFAKLKNPILRKTVAKVATLNQVAKVGNLSIGMLVNDLRKAVGQNKYDAAEQDKNMQTQNPEWFNMEKVAIKIDARPMIEAGEHPIGMVNQELSKLDNGKILELTTPFNPAPLIDMITGKGYSYYQTTEGDETFLTYFTKL